MGTELTPLHEAQGLALLLSPEHTYRLDAHRMTLMGLILRNVFRTSIALKEYRDAGAISGSDWASLFDEQTSAAHCAKIKVIDDKLVKANYMLENDEILEHYWLGNGPASDCASGAGWEIMKQADNAFTTPLDEGKSLPRVEWGRRGAMSLTVRLNMARFSLKGRGKDGKILQDFGARLGLDKGLGEDIMFNNAPWDYGYAVLNVMYCLIENEKEKEFDRLATNITDFLRDRMERLFLKGVFFEEPHFTQSTYQYSTDGNSGEVARREVSVTTTTSTEESYSEAITESLSGGFGFSKEGFSFGVDVGMEFSQEWSTTTGLAEETSTGDWIPIALTSQIASVNNGRFSAAVAIVAELNDRFGEFIEDDDDTRHIFFGDIPYVGVSHGFVDLSGKATATSEELLKNEDGYEKVRTALRTSQCRILSEMTNRSSLFYRNTQSGFECRRYVVPKGRHGGYVFPDISLAKVSMSEVTDGCRHFLQMIACHELYYRDDKRTWPAVIGKYNCWTESGGIMPIINADVPANSAVLACAGVPMSQQSGVLQRLGRRKFDTYTEEGYAHFVEGEEIPTSEKDNPIRDPVLAIEVGHAGMKESR